MHNNIHFMQINGKQWPITESQQQITIIKGSIVDSCDRSSLYIQQFKFITLFVLDIVKQHEGLHLEVILIIKIILSWLLWRALW